VPPIVAAFFALQLLHAPNLVRSLTQGVDPEVQHVRGDREPQRFTVRVAQASANWKRKPGVCRGTMIATVTQGRLTRVRIAGKEQLLDTGWSTDYAVKAGTRMSRPHLFLDPIGGAQLACRQGWVACYEDGRRTVQVTGSSSCDPLGRNANRDSRKSGKPRVAIRAPHHVMPPKAGTNAAPVRIYVDILGELTEEWWCPEIVVEWPDGTRTKRESDCEPFTGSAAQVAAGQTWSFARWLPSGNNVIRVHVYRNGNKIGSTFATVRVVGQLMPGESGGVR
jgi:hypothetical protein